MARVRLSEPLFRVWEGSLLSPPHKCAHTFLDQDGKSWRLLACGMGVENDHYLALREAVAMNDRQMAQGRERLGMTEISRLCGIPSGDFLGALIREARSANEQAAKSHMTPDQIQDEADRAFSAPSPDQIPYHRRASGMIDWPAVHGWEAHTIGGIPIAPDPA